MNYPSKGHSFEEHLSGDLPTGEPSAMFGQQHPVSKGVTETPKPHKPVTGEFHKMEGATFGGGGMFETGQPGKPQSGATLHPGDAEGQYKLQPGIMRSGRQDMVEDVGDPINVTMNAEGGYNPSTAQDSSSIASRFGSSPVTQGTYADQQLQKQKVNPIAVPERSKKVPK